MFATVLGVGFASCNDDDDAPIVLPSEIKPTVIEEALATSSEVLGDVDKDGVEKIISVGASSYDVSEIILTKDKKALIKPKSESAAKAMTSRAIISNSIICDYTIDGSNIIINAGGSIGKITIPLANAAQIMIQSTLVNVTYVTLLPPATNNEKSLCRPWSNPSYTAGIFVDKIPVWGAQVSEKTGCRSIMELKNLIVEKLVVDGKIKDEGFKLLSSDLVSVNFMTSGVVYFCFSNGTMEKSTWSWTNEAKGELKTTIDNREVNVAVRFKKGTPNTAIFVIDANTNGITGTGVHKLSGRLVVTMTE